MVVLPSFRFGMSILELYTVNHAVVYSRRRIVQYSQQTVLCGLRHGASQASNTSKEAAMLSRRAIDAYWSAEWDLANPSKDAHP